MSRKKINLFHDKIRAWTGATTLWKCTGRAKKLNLICCCGNRKQKDPRYRLRVSKFNI
jgi:hypothetical protein